MNYRACLNTLWIMKKTEIYRYDKLFMKNFGYIQQESDMMPTLTPLEFPDNSK